MTEGRIDHPPNEDAFAPGGMDTELALRPVDRCLWDLTVEDAKSTNDALADEGYRLLDADTKLFSDAAWQLASETWPEWDQR